MDVPVDKKQVEKAVSALIQHIEKQNNDNKNLLVEDSLIYLVIALTKIPKGKRNDKPIRIPLPHPIYNTQDTEICLIVKDHKGEGHKAAKAKVREDKTAGVAKVIGLSKLKSKYESFEAKRQLCNSYDLFVADDRILPSLPKLLGKSFFKKKKQPVPVKLSGKDWGKQIEKACEATYLFMSGGSSLTIRVATSSQDETHCVENIMETLSLAVDKLPGKWNGLKALYLKTAESVALPIWQASLEIRAQNDIAPKE